jgi:tRNA G10  N-methylase Trm11
VEADTTRVVEFFRAASVDLVVTDLPYGVQHGSHGSTRPGGERARDAGRALARSPLDLLRAAAPAWAKALRPGGAIGLSWNTRVARRGDVAEALAAAGMEIVEDGPYHAFRHRVDQAITRDVVVARKPGG